MARRMALCLAHALGSSFLMGLLEEPLILKHVRWYLFFKLRLHLFLEVGSS